MAYATYTLPIYPTSTLNRLIINVIAIANLNHIKIMYSPTSPDKFYKIGIKAITFRLYTDTFIYLNNYIYSIDEMEESNKMKEEDMLEELDILYQEEKFKKERAIKAVDDLKAAEERIFNKIKKRMEELAKDPVLLKEFEKELKVKLK